MTRSVLVKLLNHIFCIKVQENNGRTGSIRTVLVGQICLY